MSRVTLFSLNITKRWHLQTTHLLRKNTVTFFEDNSWAYSYLHVTASFSLFFYFFMFTSINNSSLKVFKCMAVTTLYVLRKDFFSFTQYILPRICHNCCLWKWKPLSSVHSLRSHRLYSPWPEFSRPEYWSR